MTETTQEKHGAYTTHAQGMLDDREIDKRALLSCASRLREALDAKGRDMKVYKDAIHHNQRLWTMFQVALCDPENALPRDLKMTLLSLSRYIDRTSFRAINQFAPQLLNSLIDINRTIATGLAKKQAAAPPAQAPLPTEPSLTPRPVITSA
jgi:flagellar protein FlaF